MNNRYWTTTTTIGDVVVIYELIKNKDMEKEQLNFYKK
jgi:hypothetical protein|tara:strand:- start:1252 stop:1365 length:114 start_codon:yes stop_codon:yes gene_type:complete